MHKISDLSESSTIDFQITGRGNVTPEIHFFLSRYENFNKLLKRIPQFVTLAGSNLNLRHFIPEFAD